jgi:mycoredoxin-dependent peroxiredoxin
MDVNGVSGAEQVAMLRVGDGAPDFDLPMLLKGVKGRFRLGEWVEKQNMVVTFYPLNWEAASARQAVEYQAQREKYVALGAEFVTVSVDSIMNTTAWEREIGPVDFPMCSDFWPHGEVCRRYGMLRENGPEQGTAERAIFVVDRKKRIRFQKFCGKQDAAILEDVLKVLREIQS